MELLFDSFRRKQTKKETIPYPICSVIAVFKMLVRILNTLRSRIWDMVVFLFSDYLNKGDYPESYDRKTEMVYYREYDIV